MLNKIFMIGLTCSLLFSVSYADNSFKEKIKKFKIELLKKQKRLDKLVKEKEKKKAQGKNK